MVTDLQKEFLKYKIDLGASSDNKDNNTYISRIVKSGLADKLANETK